MTLSVVSIEADAVFRARTELVFGRIVGRSWRVIRLFDLGIPRHAQLQAVDVPSLVKTVAVAALLDDRLYIRERSAG